MVVWSLISFQFGVTGRVVMELYLIADWTSESTACHWLYPGLIPRILPTLAKLICPGGTAPTLVSTAIYIQ